MNQNKLEALRIKAIKRYLEGKNPQVICKELSMSKRWLFKWIKRYKSGKRNWFKEESKVPHTIYRKTPSEVEKKVITIRRLLEETKLSQIGAINIQYQMHTLEEKKIPQIWTINRILKRNHLVNKREKRYQPTEKPYPQFPSRTFKINTLLEQSGPVQVNLDVQCLTFNNL